MYSRGRARGRSQRASPREYINTWATNAMYWCNRATTITCTCMYTKLEMTISTVLGYSTSSYIVQYTACTWLVSAGGGVLWARSSRYMSHCCTIAFSVSPSLPSVAATPIAVSSCCWSCHFSRQCSSSSAFSFSSLMVQTTASRCWFCSCNSSSDRKVTRWSLITWPDDHW